MLPKYRVVVYETDEELWHDMPELRFLAYFQEIAEASLHEYGATVAEAVKKLWIELRWISARWALPEAGTIHYGNLPTTVTEGQVIAYS